MDTSDSSKEKNAKVEKKSTNSSDKSDELSERIRRFGEKVNVFIDELRTTGETVFTNTSDARVPEKDHNDIVTSLLKGEIDENLNLITDPDVQTQVDNIKELQKEIDSLKKENSKLKQEIVSLQLQIHTISDHADETESLTVETISSTDEVHEIKEVGILNYYNPVHWDRILHLSNKNNLTLPILEILLAEEEIQLIIVSLMLENDPAQCLEVVKALHEIGVVNLTFKTQGGLNPLVTLIKHF